MMLRLILIIVASSSFIGCEVGEVEKSEVLYQDAIIKDVYIGEYYSPGIYEKDILIIFDGGNKLNFTVHNSQVDNKFRYADKGKEVILGYREIYVVWYKRKDNKLISRVFKRYEFATANLKR